MSENRKKRKNESIKKDIDWAESYGGQEIEFEKF